MPLIVDHAKRRRELALIASNLVAIHGAEGLTLRKVALQAGCTAAAVAHYFDGKLDLLESACQLASARALTVVEAAWSDGRSPEDCLAEFLPLDDRRRLDWLMWFCLWGKAAAEPSIARERVHGVAHAHDLIVRILAPVETSERVELPTLATAAQAIINGVASLAVVDADQWPADRQRTILTILLQTNLLGNAKGVSE